MSASALASALIFASASTFSRSAWALACASSAWRRFAASASALRCASCEACRRAASSSLGLGEGLGFRLLALGLRHRERLIGLPLGLGLGLRFLRCLFLQVAQGGGLRFGLALCCCFLLGPLRRRGLVDLSRSRLPARFDLRLQFGEFLFGPLQSLPGLLQLRVRLALGLGIRLGLLARFFFQPSFLHDQCVRLAPLGQHLFELLD